jgi:hypothetical protein
MWKLKSDIEKDLWKFEHIRSYAQPRFGHLFRRSRERVQTRQTMKEKRIDMIEGLRDLMMGKDDEVNGAINF